MQRPGVLVIALLVATAFVGGSAGIAVAGPDAAASMDATAGEHCEFPVTETDSTGTDVTIDDRPDEVVTLLPSAAQTMWEIGADEQVTGLPVDHTTAGLEGSDERTDVLMDDRFTVDQETVVELEPDLVLAPNAVPDETVEQLRDAGVTVFKFEAATSIEDVYEKTQLTGALVGECDAAEERVGQMQADIAAVEERVDQDDSPLIYVPMGGGFTAGEGTFVADVIETAGGENLGSTVGIQFYAEISTEDIVAEDPDMIVVTESVPLHEQPESDALNETTAIQEDNIVVVDSNEFSQPAPRVVNAIEDVANGIEAMQSTPTPTPTETPTATDSLADDESDDEDAAAAAGDDEDAPGLGVSAAVVALLSVALLARRR